MAMFRGREGPRSRFYQHLSQAGTDLGQQGSGLRARFSARLSWHRPELAAK
jgi:hypothetical protein